MACCAQCGRTASLHFECCCDPCFARQDDADAAWHRAKKREIQRGCRQAGQAAGEGRCRQAAAVAFAVAPSGLVLLCSSDPGGEEAARERARRVEIYAAQLRDRGELDYQDERLFR